MSGIRLIRGSLPVSAGFTQNIRRVFEAAKAPALEEAAVSSVSGPGILLGVGLTACEQQKLKLSTGALTSVVSTAAGKFYPQSIYKDAQVVSVASHLRDAEELFELTVESQRVALAGINTKVVSGGLVTQFQKQREATLAKAEAALLETVKVAIAEARRFPDKQRFISLVYKDQGRETSPFDALLLDSIKKYLSSLGDAAKDVSLEHSSTATVTNKIIMFPETVRVILTPPEYYGERLEKLIQGIGGGVGVVPVTFTNGTSSWIYTSNSQGNPIAPLLSAVGALRNDAVKQAAVADKIEAAIGKALATTVPADLPNGKANPDQFVDAVVKNLH